MTHKPGALKKAGVARDVDQEFGESVVYRPDPLTINAYYPTRLEYLYASILSGLLSNAAPKEYSKSVGKALEIAVQAESELSRHERHS